MIVRLVVEALSRAMVAGDLTDARASNIQSLETQLCWDQRYKRPRRSLPAADVRQLQYEKLQLPSSIREITNVLENGHSFSS